jgi:uncharacterized protein
MMKTYVLYHSNCWDGFCAAWIAQSVLSKGAEYIPVQYGEPLPEIENDSVVYILDFSYKRDVMKELISKMSQVIVLDHHKTAQAELEGLAAEFSDSFVHKSPVIVFDREKSGGRLTWEHFYGDRSVPLIVRMTEDRDLWRWKLPFSREINAVLRSYPLDFKTWDWISEVMENGSPSM